MPDFTVADKFNKNKGFTSVKFGADSPVLEVELNEMQKILNYRNALATSLILNDGFATTPAITVESGTITVPACTIVVGGEVIEILEAMTLTGLSTNDIVYLKVTEEEIAYNETLKESGNLSGGSTLTNDLLDSRVGVETSRRIQKQVQLVKVDPTPASRLEVAKITGASSFDDKRTVAWTQMVNEASTIVSTHEAEAVYLQEDEPEATNSTTLWFDSNSEINFSAGGVAIYNAETSATPPETVFWFQPV